jgi:hypothetical protein
MSFARPSQQLTKFSYEVPQVSPTNWTRRRSFDLRPGNRTSCSANTRKSGQFDLFAFRLFSLLRLFRLVLLFK